jgi:uncharacterized protein (AIM24 family)
VPGAMTYMEPSMQMSVNCNNCAGRCMSCTSPILASYTNLSESGDAVVGLTPNFPAKIVPLMLTPGVVYRNKTGAFFASYGNVDIGYDFDCNPATCCFGGQGCVRQTLGGEGTAFVAAMGTLMTKELGPGETIIVDTHSLVAWSETVTLDIRTAGGLCTCCCGGEGMFNTTLTGPGVVYFQSMSFQKFKAALQLTVQANNARGGAAAGGAAGAFAAMGGGPSGVEEMER